MKLDTDNRFKVLVEYDILLLCGLQGLTDILMFELLLGISM